MHGRIAFHRVYVLFNDYAHDYVYGGIALNIDAYLLSVVGTILLGAVLTAIIPEGKTAGIVRSMTKLVCLLVIISPILSYLSAEKAVKTEKNFTQSVIQTDESFIQYYSELRVVQTEQAITQELQKEFGMDCVVRLEWLLKEERIQITQICVQAQETCDEEVKARMCEYLIKNYCSEVLLE